MPWLDKIFNTVCQEESHRNIMIGRYDRNGTNVAFAIKHLNKGQAVIEKVGHKHCDHLGHDESKCFKIIGYPPDWGTRGKGSGCGKRMSYGGGRGEATPIVMLSATTGTTRSKSDHNFGLHHRVGLTHSKLIDTPKGGYENLSSKGEWLFDIGASYHMIGHFQYLDNVQSIDPIMVGLPNGRQDMANKIGTITLGSNLRLKDVLLFLN